MRQRRWKILVKKRRLKQLFDLIIEASVAMEDF